MEQFEALKNSLFSKSLLTGLAWLSIALPVGLIVYALYGGASPELANYLLIAAAGIFIVGFLGVFLVNSLKITKRKKTVHQIFNKWHESFGVPSVKGKNKAKEIDKLVSTTWTDTNQLETFSFNDGYNPNVSPATVIGFTEELRQLAKKGKKEAEFEYVVKLEEVSFDGSLYAKKTKVDDNSYRLFFAKIQTASIITEVVGDRYGSLPLVQFSGDFELGESDDFSTIMVQGSLDHLSIDEVSQISSKLSEMFPVEEGLSWTAHALSPNVFIFNVSENGSTEVPSDLEESFENLEEDEGFEPEHDFEADGIFVLKAFEAAARKAEVEGVEVSDIDLIDFKGSEPYGFAVTIDIAENVELEEVFTIAKYVTILLRNKYEGVWKVANQLDDSSTLTFQRFE